MLAYGSPAIQPPIGSLARHAVIAVIHPLPSFE
jgi:hypothetical protein